MTNKEISENIDKEYEAPEHKSVHFCIPLGDSEGKESDYNLESESHFDEVKNIGICDRDNPKICLALYLVQDQFGSRYELRANDNMPGVAGVTYGQRIGLSSREITAVTTIAPGERQDLGYRNFGPGQWRYVRIISVWWD